MLGARYVSAGLQLRAFSRPSRSLPGVTSGALGARRSPIAEAGARLEIEGAVDARVVRVQVPGARSVEVMADFTDWVAVHLTEVRPGVWEGRMPVSAGMHRVNLRIDGGAWTVPAGARIEANEFGGNVGVILVP